MLEAAFATLPHRSCRLNQKPDPKNILKIRDHNVAEFHLILASQSPRRRELLREAGYDFEVIAPDPGAECGICSRETPPELVARLAMQKAADVAPKVESGIVIGCDTVDRKSTRLNSSHT